MEGTDGADGDRARALAENSAAEGDNDRGSRYGLVRCASQSSLDESSQRGAGGAAEAAADGAHAAALLAGLARLRGAGALCDVRLMARASADAEPGAPLWAHRAVLAAASPYFHAMFTQFEERSRPEVTIQNVEPHALEAIVEYVYCPRSLRVTERNVQALLAAGSLLALPGVRDAAAAFLAAALQPDNALGIRAFADLHACADLRRRASDYVDAHFQQVVQAEEFLALSADALASLLPSDRLVVPSEEVVLDALLAWLRAEPAARQPHLGALLEHVRLPLLPQEALLARAGAAPLHGAAADLRVKDLLIEALSRPRPSATWSCCGWTRAGGAPPPRCRRAGAAPGWPWWTGARTPWAGSTARCACGRWTCTTSRRTRGARGRRWARAAPRWAWPCWAAPCTRWAGSTAPRGSARRRRWTRARRPGAPWPPCPRAAPPWAWRCWRGGCTPWAGTTAPPDSVCTPSRGTTRRRTRGRASQRWPCGAPAAAWESRTARCTRWEDTTGPRCAAPWSATGPAASGAPRPACTRRAATRPWRRTAAACTWWAETTAPPTCAPWRCSTRPRTRGRCCRPPCPSDARTQAWPCWSRRPRDPPRRASRPRAAAAAARRRWSSTRARRPRRQSATARARCRAPCACPCARPGPPGTSCRRAWCCCSAGTPRARTTCCPRVSTATARRTVRRAPTPTPTPTPTRGAGSLPGTTAPGSGQPSHMYKQYLFVNTYINI